MLKARYVALGFQRKPESRAEIENGFCERLERYKDSTKRDRAMRRLLCEARDMCFQEVRG